MIYCESCQSFFEEANQSRECVGEYFGRPTYQTIYTCPDCGSTEIEEAHECPICGNTMRGNEDFCEGCIDFADCVITEALKQIQDGLNIGYKEALELLTEQIERRN